MFTVSVPATTANLGPGYDVLGMALGLRNRFHFERSDRWMAGEEAVEPGAHLALETARRAAARFGGSLDPLRVRWEERVPRARGLGSSATARVAGLEAGLHFAGRTVGLAERLQFLADEEGHPDNAVPAAVGGLTLCRVEAGRLVHLRFDPPALQVALCIPAHEVSTEAARARIPARVDHRDAVFNVGAVGFLVAGLLTGRPEAVRHGLRDRLHQPHRAPLIGPVEQAFEGARAAGALGAFVSGSGSALAALVEEGVDAGAVAEALAAPFGAGARAMVLRPDPDGVRVG